MKLKKPRLESSRKGDLAEYYAVTWLWDNGYEVFKNCGCTGPTDLIVVTKDGKMLPVDVKTGRFNASGKPCTNNLSDHQQELGVNVIAFNAETRKCRWVNHYHETAYSRYRDEQES